MGKSLIIQADFYPHISKLLKHGAIKVLDDAGFSHDIISVPGALEIPCALDFVLQAKHRSYDVFIVLGCIIRGETSHYDIVCSESARGVYDLVLKKGLCLGNGILTVENESQAFERANPEKKDKGGSAARAAIDMLNIKRLYAPL